MPRRKIVEEAGEESDLSPPPVELLDGLQAVAGANGHTEEGEDRPKKKRKTKETTNAGEAGVSVGGDEVLTSGPVKRRAVKRKVKEEVEVDAVTEDRKVAPKKSRPRKQQKEVEAQVDESEEIVERNVKVKRKSKAEKERELTEMPLATRTVGHKLLIGAHVSAAGGTFARMLACRHHQVLNLVLRRPPSHPKQRPHRRKCLRPLPQVPT